MPKFNDRGFLFDVPDEWWIAAGMQHFTPEASSFAAGEPEQDRHLEGLSVLVLDIARIRAPRRSLKYGVFSDGGYGKYQDATAACRP